MRQEVIDNTFHDFEELLKGHDWFYVYASGPAYKEGEAQWDTIKAAMEALKKIDGPRTMNIFRKYCPEV